MPSARRDSNPRPLDHEPCTLIENFSKGDVIHHRVWGYLTPVFCKLGKKHTSILKNALFRSLVRMTRLFEIGGKNKPNTNEYFFFELLLNSNKETKTVKNIFESSKKDKATLFRCVNK